MEDYNSWSDINWYALGSFLTQLAFLAAAVWFARNFLASMKSFEEQIAALLKLSVSGRSADQRSNTDRTVSALTEASPYWLAPSAKDSSAVLSGPAESKPGQLSTTWHRVIGWLQAPMHSAEASAWRRMVNWLQSPAGS